MTDDPTKKIAKTITVVGLGKIGLPLAVQCASKNFRVIGADINESTVNLVNLGIEPFPGEAYLQEKLSDVVSKGLLSATTDTTFAVSRSEVVLVVVPVYVNSEGVPDFEWMDAATRAIGEGLKPGTLVSYETTLPVGTTRNRFGKILQETSGLLPGADFDLAFSPERVFSGKVFNDLRTNPKIVGGVNTQSGKAATAFYSEILDFDQRDDLETPNGVWDMGSTEASELVKLAETTYRDVNIGLANQFAKYAIKENLNIAEVIKACNSQPFSHIHSPGIAVGGHCIPVYPKMYLWNDPDATIVSAARRSNETMPKFSLELIYQDMKQFQGKRVAILGASYRGNVKETAFSGVFPVARLLTEYGALVSVHDPFFSDQELEAIGLTPHELGSPADIVIIQADHNEYKTLDESNFPELKVILDGRDIIKKINFMRARVIKLNNSVN